MFIESFSVTISAIEARLVSPSASEEVLIRVPRLVHSDRPLDIEVTAVRQRFDGNDCASLSVARWMTAHARLSIAVEAPEQHGVEVSVPVAARPCSGGWIARALMRPAAWADAASVTVVSLTLAGRPMPCDCLPATLRVGYNHSPASEGEVIEAAQADDVAALQAALDAGGSTEEADAVREGRAHMRASGEENKDPVVPLCVWCRTA